MRYARPEQRGKTRSSSVIALLLAALLLSGCDIGSARKDPLELKVEQLQQEKADLAGELEQSQVEITRLTDQVKALTALPKGERENPYRIAGIKVTAFTNFYDKNKDGRIEKFIVYLQPIDPEGDVVKAAGTVHVQLWNLNNPSDQALLGQWEVSPAELRKLWVASLVTTNYRLTFDAPGGPELLAKPLTAKVTFTDYITGEVFRAQRVIEPQEE
jgi:hypothetical protein